MIVAKDPGSAKKATSFAERLHLGIAVIHGTPKDDDGQHDGESSPPLSPSASVPGRMDKIASTGLDIMPGKVMSILEKTKYNYSVLK